MKTQIIGLEKFEKEVNDYIGRTIKELRTILDLTANDLEEVISITPPTIYKIEKGEESTSIDTLSDLIFFFGYEYKEFFALGDNLPNQKQLLRRMKKFHTEHASNIYQLVEEKLAGKKPELLIFIHDTLLPTKLFDDWIESGDVDEYIKETYGYLYSNVSAVLLEAVDNGWLVSKKKYDRPNSRINLYKRK